MQDARADRGAMVCVVILAAVLGTVLVNVGTPDTRSVASASRVTDSLALPSVSTTAATAAAAPTTTVAVPTTTADPGALPQTDERPAGSGETFTAGVTGLWDAIRQDRPELALPFFFPKRAYLQVKAINDPATDYQQRLIANYEEDIHALHAQLGAGASRAELVGIDVPDSQAVSVAPGEESNKLSYWRVYGSTLRYQLDGQTGSFPVTSLISWRGQWYVVHLGAIR